MTLDSLSRSLTLHRAAKTALLLDSTQLGKSQVHVSQAAGLGDIAGSKDGASASKEAAGDGDEISQDDKPRSRVVAEYLAHGYALSDQAIQRAIALDQKHGISSRFTNALTSFDDKYKATDRAKGLDESYKISHRATDAWTGLNSYFEKAMGTPTGQKLVSFYAKGDKEVRDIHNEARRLADLKQGKSGGAGPAGENFPVPVSGTDKTTCNCGGSTGVCPCEPGKCACSGCGKSSVQGEKSATGPADTVAAATSVPPLESEKKA